MKYYRALISATNGYITKDNVYKEIDHGNDKNSITTFVTISEWIKTIKTLSREIEFEEVSKQEYLLFKVKELKVKILDKSNGFYLIREHFNLFCDILDIECKTYNNIRSENMSKACYAEQISIPERYNYRFCENNTYIKNLNLINFKDLIDEIKQIRDET